MHIRTYECVLQKATATPAYCTSALTELAWVYAYGVYGRIKADVDSMEEVDADNFAKNAADKKVALKQKGCKATAVALVQLTGAMQSGDLAAVVRPCAATPLSAPGDSVASIAPHRTTSESPSSPLFEGDRQKKRQRDRRAERECARACEALRAQS